MMITHMIYVNHMLHMPDVHLIFILLIPASFVNRKLKSPSYWIMFTVDSLVSKFLEMKLDMVKNKFL